MTENEPRARQLEGPQRFCLIVGAMKSGTTSLFDLLAQHPEVAPCRTKEPDFFRRQRDPAASWDAYTSLWDWTPGLHRVALEASVSYAKAPWVPEVPRRISSVSGVEFRFIYMMRHPLRRIESQVRHSIFEGWGKPLDEEIPRDLIDFSRYAMQIDRYLEFFPREAILPITLDELRDAPSDVLRRCCRFLGVSEGFDFRSLTERRNTGDFYSVPPAVGAMARNQGVRAVARALLPRGLHNKVRSFLGRKLERRGSLGRWQLSPEEEEQILDELRADLRRLETEFGVDVAGLWGISPAPLQR